MSKTKKPIPFDEALDKDRFWPYEPFDNYLPSSKGFLTDFIYHNRGCEVPTIFNIWSGLYTLSTLIKREAWIEWGRSKLFANLYIIMVAPPGIGKKSTAVNHAGDLLLNLNEEIKEINMQEIKKLKTLKNKATPEAMLEKMRVPAVEYVLKNKDGTEMRKSDGTKKTYPRSSALGLMISELAVMFSKQSYSESLIENLMDLYDTSSEWTWNTVGRGEVKLLNLYTTLLGATTISGFQDSIPKAALGDGFLSRTILAYAPNNVREYALPREVPNGPKWEDLRLSLAWIAENTKGKYKLTKEAQDFYIKWYHDFRKGLDTAPPELQGIISRKNINILKIAFLLSRQRYEVKNIITLTDIHDALKLLDATFKTAPLALADIGASEMTKITTKIEKYIREKKRVMRSVVLTRRHVRMKDLNNAISQLNQEGKVKIMRNGERKPQPSSTSTEEYIWIPQPGEDDHEKE